MRIPLTTAVVIALAACSQPSSTTTTTTATSNTTTTTATTATTPTTATTTTTASTVTTGTGVPTAASLGLQPGKWETRISVTSMEIDGVNRPAPPGAGGAVLTCLTPEMAAKGPGEMLKKAGVNCTTTTASYSGGKIAAQMTCKMPMGTMTTTTTGTYSPTAMTSDADATVTGRMSMREKIHTEARRVGACG